MIKELLHQAAELGRQEEAASAGPYKCYLMDTTDIE